MASPYLQFSTKRTPQSESLPGQVANSAGGFSYGIDKWQRLDRFLILGSEGGTYYIGERKLTKDNAQNVLACIAEDGQRVVAKVVEISEDSRAPKNDPALFALALCLCAGDPATKSAVVTVCRRVARIGTHLFHFVDYCQQNRGWGRLLRKAVSKWYTGQSAEDLALQLVKYQARDGWSHRDLIQLAHPKPPTEEHNRLFKYVMDGQVVEQHPAIVHAMKAAHATETPWAPGRKAEFLKVSKLPRECLPTEWLNDPEVWKALLPTMPMTALIRNLGNLSKHKVLAPGKFDEIASVVSKLLDQEQLKKARVHPIQMLSALMTYQSGHGVRGSSTWDVVPDVVDALDQGFYKAFGNVTPTGKRIMVALDVSGSMSSGEVAGVPGLAPRIASSAMAMVTYKVEPKVVLMAFSGGFVPMDISRVKRLDDIVRSTAQLPFGRTDCALPMLYALAEKLLIDTFIVYTDSETWAGKIHPVEALREYRRKFVPDAKLIVVGMTSNGFTIADPRDAGMLDVVGFDTATPNIMSWFMTQSGKAA